MRNDIKLVLPKGKYVSGVEINDSDLRINLKKKQKVALLFICLNERYWPYIVQVMKDCKEKFLPHHNVEYFLWTDIGNFEETYKTIQKDLNNLSERVEKQDINLSLKEITDYIIPLITRFQIFEVVPRVVKELAEQRLVYKRDADKMWIETDKVPGPWMATTFLQAGKTIIDSIKNDISFVTSNATIMETESMEWPIPTLMRYHLFLNQEEKLKKFDSIFYLDADMHVVEKISDEVLSKELTAAPHPGYAVNSKFIPPYEPNTESAAYIPRLGHVTTDETGKKRFTPFYAAGGFQGGSAKAFIKAMKVMKKSIEKDFDKNYTAIWNDESHWNKYLFDYQKKGGAINFLDVSYIHPDSLIKEYYEKIWGRSYVPKIVTLTKPFSLSTQAGEELKSMTNNL